MNSEQFETTNSSRNWVPVALSADLQYACVMRALVHGEQPLDLVVWRTTSGQVSAFDNRCPHRGMRLSFGFVRGERLSCIYHGWQYGENGVCNHIPAHPDMTPPATICALSYKCQDFDGVVWISRAESQPERLPEFSGTGLRSLSVNLDQAKLRSVLKEFELPGFVRGKSQTAHFNVVTENQTSLVIESGPYDAALQLIVHFQSVTPDKTILHFQTGRDLAADQQVLLSRWTERLRWSAENLGNVTHSMHANTQEMRP